MGQRVSAARLCSNVFDVVKRAARSKLKSVIFTGPHTRYGIGVYALTFDIV